ncbi:MAG: efflux RND transporter periplasmic adaptor subunit [Rikenellaceae bacterium]|nr:efflux RND transporter periplasmic adaptor subunit [Rikenellaceae bacterium]
MGIYKVIPLFIILLSVSACRNKSGAELQSQQPQGYPIQVLREQSAVLWKNYPVRLRGREDIDVRPRINGTITSVYVDEGDIVKKGQPLFSIDSPSAVEAVASAEASVASARANMASARLDVERLRSLAEKNIISNVQLQAYENQYRGSMASVEQSEASLVQARTTLGWTTVTSPVDGIVGTIPYRNGSLVGSTDVLTTIANSSDIIAYFSMNEKEFLEFLNEYPGDNQSEKISNIPELKLILADGAEYTEGGFIETISGIIDDYTGSVSLRAVFPNPSGMLRSGMSGVVSIPKNIRRAIIVPQKSTVAQQDKTLIYKVQGDSVVQTVITVIPISDGKEYLVNRGLEPGDTIVTDGVATHSNGKKITVK